MNAGSFFVSGSSLGVGAYLTVFGGVAVGSVLPIIPTGAVVSAAAAIAGHDNPVVVVLVVLVAAAAALVGDLITFAGCRLAGEPALRWVRGGRNAEQSGTLAHAKQRLVDRPYPVLMTMRLVPAGRIPTLLAAGLTDISWRSFVTGQAMACLLWSVIYTVLGIAGGAAFAQPWEAVVAAVVLVLLVSVIVALVQHLRAGHDDSDDAAAAHHS